MPPKPNYSFEKRQRELEKKKKKAEKAMKKSTPGGQDEPDQDHMPSEALPDAPNAPNAPTEPS